jgi:hypothetical protein
VAAGPRAASARSGGPGTGSSGRRHSVEERSTQKPWRSCRVSERLVQVLRIHVELRPRSRLSSGRRWPTSRHDRIGHVVLATDFQEGRPAGPNRARSRTGGGWSADCPQDDGRAGLVRLRLPGLAPAPWADVSTRAAQSSSTSGSCRTRSTARTSPSAGARSAATARLPISC